MIGDMVGNAQKLATNYVNNKIEDALKDLNFNQDDEPEKFKLLLGREIAKAYALGYADGWEKQSPKELYV